MSENPTRLFGAMAVLAVLWIVVYWAVDPSGAPRVSFDDQPPAAAVDTPRPDGDDADSGQPPAVEPGVERPADSGRDEAVPVVGRPPLPESAIRGVIAPEFDDYTIRHGDTLASIARDRLGSARHADAIARSNPLMSPDRLTAGRVIRIPRDPANIQGRPAEVAAPSDRPDGQSGSVAPATYVVARGDALTLIAQRHYGSSRWAGLIFEANRDRLGLRDMDSIREGQELILPPLPSDGSR